MLFRSLAGYKCWELVAEVARIHDEAGLPQALLAGIGGPVELGGRGRHAHGGARIRRGIVLVLLGRRRRGRSGGRRLLDLDRPLRGAPRRVVVRLAAGPDGGPVVQHADGAVLADPVRDLPGVDPHRQLAREEAGQDLLGPAALGPGPGQDRVHLVVDADAAVAGPLARLFWEPVLLVVVAQHVLQLVAEVFEPGGLALAVDPHQVGEEVRRFLYLHSHLCGRFFSLVVLKCLWWASFESVVDLRPSG